MGRVPSIVVAMLSITLLFTSPDVAEGEVYADTVILRWGESVGFRINNTALGAGSLSYTVNVLSGPPVNVYFVDEEGYSDYHESNGTSFTEKFDYTTTGTSAVERSWILQDFGVFWIIIENGYDTARRNENATVQYRVDWEPNTFDPIYLWVMLVALIVIVTIFVTVLSIWMLRRRADRSEQEGEEDQPPLDEKEYTVTRPPPKPPEPYSEKVVRKSEREHGR